MTKKQIVFIMTDTTNRNMLGCYGDNRMKTPHLDKMATKGIKYDNAYTCQPVCGPARSALFTGTFPHTNGMVTNSIALGNNVKTLGQRLSDNNITCGYIGKWHLDGSDYFGNGFCPEGYESKYWYDMRTYLEELSPVDRLRSRQSKTAYEGITQEFTYAHGCTKRALNFIDEFKNDDFCLCLSYDEPHGPYLSPEPYNTMYDGFKMDDNPNYFDTLENKPLIHKLWAGDNLNKSDEQIKNDYVAQSLFLGCNSFVDDQIGKVLDKIYEQIPDALVFYTSDHGDMMSSLRINGGKNACVYKEVANIPLIIMNGKNGECNKTVQFPASHIDIMPTILDYMGVAMPKVLEGKSMLKQIVDPTVKIRDNAFVEFTRYEVDHDGFGGLQMMRAITNEHYKLALYLLDSDEMYDLEKDPYEMNNIINDENYSEIRNELHDTLLEHMNQTRDLYRGYQWATRSWRPEKVATFNNDEWTRQRENEEYEPRQLDYDTGLPMTNSLRKKILV